MKSLLHRNRRWPASILAFALLTCAAALAQSGQPTMTALSAATNSPLAGANDIITITVSPANSGATPTGSVAIAVDNAIVNPSIALTNGVATYTFSASSGSHVITAYYSGDQTYAASIGTVTISIASKTFVITASSPTVTAGSPAISTVTLTPLNGYTGTVSFTVASNSQTEIPCFSAPDASVSGTTPVTVSLTMQTKASSCPSAALRSRDKDVIAAAASLFTWPHDGRSMPPGTTILAVFGFGALIALFARRVRRSWLVGVVMIFVLAGCGSGGSSSNLSAGTYSLIVSGLDKTQNVAASTTIVLTVQ